FEREHEPASTQERAATLPRGGRPWPLRHVAGAVGDPRDRGRPRPPDRFRRGGVDGRGSLLLLHHRAHHRLWGYRAAAGAHARTRGRDRLWRHPSDRPGGWNRRQCNACDPDGRRETLTSIAGGESPVNTQNRAVYSFAAQTSPIPAAIERRYVG